MSAFLSPVFGAGSQLFTDQGVILVGGKISTFIAGSTTPKETWSDSSQVTSNGVEITLDSYGRVPVEIWLESGIQYKFSVTDAFGVTVGYTYDYISGINDISVISASNGEWVSTGLSPAFVSATQLSFSGDQTAVFPVGTRVKSTVTAGTAYSTVSAVSFAGGSTTVTLVSDSTAIDTGVSEVWTGIATATGQSISPMGVAWTDQIDYTGSKVLGAPVQAARQVTTTTGTATAYVLAPAPATYSLTRTNQWFVKFHTAGSGSPTLNVSGLGAKNLKQYASDGSKIAFLPASGQVADVLYDGTDFVVGPLPQVDAVSFAVGQTLADPGSQSFPGGLIMKWGSVSVGDIAGGGGSTGTVTYGTAFPNATLNVQLTISDASSSVAGAAFFSNISAAAFDYRVQEWATVTQNATLYWLALGH